MRRIDTLYASVIRIRQIFRVCESTRMDGETFRGENAQGATAISVEARFSPRRDGRKRYVPRFHIHIHVDIYCIETIYAIILSRMSEYFNRNNEDIKSVEAI